MVKPFSYRDGRCSRALYAMPKQFRFQDFRKQAGAADFGPEVSACRQALRTYKAKGLIRNLPHSHIWEKT